MSRSIDWSGGVTRKATASDFAKPTYKLEPHSFKKMRGVSYLCCSECGLLTLKNPFTAWATKMGCLNEHHPDHARQRRMTGEART